jgi:hypothetical protein
MEEEGQGKEHGAEPFEKETLLRIVYGVAVILIIILAVYTLLKVIGVGGFGGGTPL